LAALKRDRINQRLIGTFAFSHAQRGFDGIDFEWNRTDRQHLTIMAAIPTRGVFQTDGWGHVNVAGAYAAWTQTLKWRKTESEVRLFGIYYDDERSVVKTDNRTLVERQQDLEKVRLTTLGGHYLGAIESASGMVDLLAWAALQTGTWGLLSHRAAALALEAGFQPRVLPKIRPWLRASYDYGSGDRSPEDRTHGTFSQLLPTPRLYARFPFFNLMNNRDLFGELIMRPHSRFTIRADVHSLRLASRNDLWYQGGGAFQPWSLGFTGRPSNGASGLATLYDIGADYTWGAHTSVGGYYGRADGKSVIEKIYPSGHNAQFGFVEVNYRF
jgi:hypothetical protein